MLQDQKRTRFVVVCIAEYLSVSETQRLLQELQKNRVRVSHIIVNQLVVKSALGKEELAEVSASNLTNSMPWGSDVLNTLHDKSWRDSPRWDPSCWTRGCWPRPSRRVA